VWHCSRDPTFSRFSITLTYDRRMDRQTHNRKRERQNRQNSEGKVNDSKPKLRHTWHHEWVTYVEKIFTQITTIPTVPTTYRPQATHKPERVSNTMYTMYENRLACLHGKVHQLSLLTGHFYWHTYIVFTCRNQLLFCLCVSSQLLNKLRKTTAESLVFLLSFYSRW